MKAMMAELYQTIVQKYRAIHQGEQQKGETCKEYLRVQTEGKRNISRPTYGI